MNVERIRQLAAHLREPTTAPHFDMDRWLQSNATNRMPIGQAIYTCGTVACIAGHATALFQPDIWVESVGVWEIAERLLGLTEDEASDLFLPTDFRDNLSTITPEEAAATLDHLAATGEVDWTVADNALSQASGEGE